MSEFLKPICKLAVFAMLSVSLPLIAHDDPVDEARQNKQVGGQQKEDGLLGGSGVKSIGVVDDENTRQGSNRGRSTGNGQGGLAQRNGKSITDLNGRRTISMDEAKGRITVKITLRYDPSEHAQLVAKHPDLADYIELFPTDVDGSEIAMTLAITTSYRARSPEELEKKHPEAFNVYRRYHKRLLGRDRRLK